MTLGTNRIRDLTPTSAEGRWGHALAEIFGCTIWDPPAVGFTLRSISAELTTALGVVTPEAVHNGAAFQAPWNAAGSGYNAGTGVLTMERVGGFAAGMQIRFTVCSRGPGTDDVYARWYVGIGDPPDMTDPPVVTDRVRINGQHYRITGTVGAPGAIRYVCAPTNHAMAGVVHATRNDFEYVSPRGRLDTRVMYQE